MYNVAKIFTLCLMLLVAGCRAKEPQEKKSASPGMQPESAHSGMQPGAAHAPGAQPAPPAGADSLKFTPPAGWVSESPSSSIRRAQYKLPRISGDPEDAEMAVFYFGEQGGGTPQANIDRWIGMFQSANGKSDGSNAQVKHKTIHGLEVTTLDVKGSYNNSMMGSMQGGQSSAKEHFRMLAAVVETANGPWFLKLTGPEKTVEKWRPSFDQFLDSVEQK